MRGFLRREILWKRWLRGDLWGLPVRDHLPGRPMRVFTELWVQGVRNQWMRRELRGMRRGDFLCRWELRLCTRLWRGPVR